MIPGVGELDLLIHYHWEQKRSTRGFHRNEALFKQGLGCRTMYGNETKSAFRRTKAKYVRATHINSQTSCPNRQPIPILGVDVVPFPSLIAGDRLPLVETRAGISRLLARVCGPRGCVLGHLGGSLGNSWFAVLGLDEVVGCVDDGLESIHRKTVDQ